MGILDELLARQTGQMDSMPEANTPEPNPAPANPAPQNAPAPKNPNFLRNLLTDFIGTLSGQLKSGSFQQAVGEGIQAGTARGGTPGQAFGASFGGLPAIEQKNKMLKAQMQHQMNIETMTQQQRDETLRHNQAVEKIQTSGVQQRADAATQRAEVDRTKANISLRKFGVRINDSGDQEAIPNSELSPQEIAHLRADEKLSGLRDAMMERDKAATEYQKALLQEDSVPNRLKRDTLKQQLELANRRLDLAAQGLELRTPEMKAAAAQTLAASQMRVQYSTMRTINLAAQKRGHLTGPESMALLAGHMAMTVGTIKGARTGRDLIQAHIKARSLSEDMEALANRVINGGVLTLEQAKQFTSLAEMRLNEIQSEADRLRNQGRDQGETPVYDLNGNRVRKP